MSTTSIKSNVYPLVESALSNPNIKKKYKESLSNFISKRSGYLNDSLPINRIAFGEPDIAMFFDAMGIDRSKITDAISNTYYGPMKQFNPAAAKDEFTVTILMVIRYYLEKNLKVDLEAAMLYMAFSGKFYPSVHYRSFPFEPNRYVMEYVVNNRLSNKFDLASTGSVVGAVKSICNTWISTYKSKIVKCDDESCVYVIQQLHSRVGSFMKNIATEYYKEHSAGKNVMTYDSDSYDKDSFHMADSDSLKIQRVIEKAVNRVNSYSVDYRICTACGDENIRANEVKSIMDSIIGDSNNNANIRELINAIVMSYYTNYTGKDKDVRDISFITYSIAAKPNAKQREILRVKELIENFLVENSTAYIRRRSRIATKNSYERAILMYFTMIIHDANRM